MGWKSTLQSAAISLGLAASVANVQPVEKKATETVPQTPDKATTISLRRGDMPGWMEGHDGGDRKFAFPFGLERGTRSIFRESPLQTTRVETETQVVETKQPESPEESEAANIVEVHPETNSPVQVVTSAVLQQERDELVQNNRQVVRDALNARFREQRALREARANVPQLPLTITDKQRVHFAKDLSLMPTVLEKGYGAETQWLSNELLLADENSELMPTAEELQYAVQRFKPKTKNTFFSQVSAEQIISYSNKYKLETGQVIDPVVVLGFIHAENQILTDGNPFDRKNHNPGELRSSPLASGYAENRNGRFARFRNLPTGVEAIFENFVADNTYVHGGLVSIGEIKERYTPWGDGNNNPRLSALNVLKSSYHIREGILELRLKNTTDPVLRKKYEDQIQKVKIGIKETNKQMLAYMNIKGKASKVKK